MKDGVSVMEEVFRADRLFEVAAIYWNPLQSEALCNVLNKLGVEVRASPCVRGGRLEKGHEHGATATFLGFCAIAVKVEWKDGSDIEQRNGVFVDQAPSRQERPGFRSPGLAQCDEAKVLAREHVVHERLARRADEALRLTAVPGKTDVEWPVENWTEAFGTAVSEHIRLCVGYFPVSAVLLEVELLAESGLVELPEIFDRPSDAVLGEMN